MATRAKELRCLLDTEISSAADPAAIATLDAALKAVEGAQKRLDQPRQTMFLLVSFTTLMVGALFAVGLYFTLSETSFRMHAKVWAATITTAAASELGSMEPPPLTSYSTFEVKELYVLQGDELLERRFPMARIEELRIANNTTFELIADRRDCLVLRILNIATPAVGATIYMGVTGDDEPNLPPEYPHQLGLGQYARFCGIESVEPLLIGAVRAINLTRVYRDDIPRLEASTVLEGSLSLFETGDQHILFPTDRLVLQGLRSTNLILRPSEGVLVITADGHAADPQIFGGVQSIVGRTLLPTLLDYITRSPLALLFGLAVGFFGTIWNGLKVLRSW